MFYYFNGIDPKVKVLFNDEIDPKVKVLYGTE
jgi:hypothetical protein